MRLLIPRCCRLTLLAGLLVLSASLPTRGGEAATYQDLHSAECRRQLNILFEACQAYAEDKGKLPGNLSSLVGKYLADEAVLLCPVAKAKQSYDLGENFRNHHDVDLMTAYNAEFHDGLTDQWVAAGKKISERTYKHLQRETSIGDRVPIIRCMKHARCLNLGYDGKIFESGRYWEANFVDVIPQPYLYSGLLLLGPVSERLEKRNVVDPLLLDLSPAYNALYEDPWWVGHGHYGLAGLSSSISKGLYESGGRRFDVRGIVQLGGKPLSASDGEKGFEHGFTSAMYPYSSKVIEVGRVCAQIHLLAGTLFEEPNGTPIAEIVFEYSGERERVVEIVYGEHLESFWYDPDGAQAKPVCVPVWIGTNQPASDAGKKLRFYCPTIANPNPNEPVLSLQFRSARTTCAPFILGATIE